MSYTCLLLGSGDIGMKTEARRVTGKRERQLDSEPIPLAPRTHPVDAIQGSKKYLGLLVTVQQWERP